MTYKLLLAGAVIGASVLAGIAAASTPEPRPIRLADATMIIEVNATDGDAGLQAFLDGDAWRSMTITGPNGRRFLDVHGGGRLGLTELFTESHEPTFEELPLRRFLRRFPAGTYRFAGTDVDGRRVVGRAKLSHDIPPGPRITAPRAGAVTPRTGVVADWEPVPERGGVDIAGYRAIVEREDPLRVFSVDLPASATSVTIPAEFLEADTEYKLEVQAIEASGNQTLTELSFRVG